MWKLQYKGITKTFEEWGVNRPTRKLISLDPDLFEFQTPTALREDSVFEHGQVVTVFNGDLPWFKGLIDQTPKTATGRYQSHGYVVVGAWWYLQMWPYQQTWKELANPLDPTDGLVTKYRGHLLLGYDASGAYLTTKQIIVDALTYGLACAAEAGMEPPFQIGTINIPDIYPPVREVANRSCADVILMLLRWTPDAIGIVDYTVTPPRLEIVQRTGLETVTLDVFNEDLKEVNLRPRYDLQVPSVLILYERVNVVDGLAYPEIIPDAAPIGATGRELGAVVDTINLEGSVISYAYSEIVCEEIATGDLDWWRTNNRLLSGERIKNLSITNVLSGTSYPRQLVSGTIAPWMLSTVFGAQRDVIQAKATYDLMNEEGTEVLEHKKDVYVQVEVVATNLVTNIYKTIESATLAEPVPIGLAGYLYAATNPLQWDGGFNLVEDECSGKLRIGNLINITSGAKEYETMGAVVQNIVEDISTGVTSVVVGPPKHLGKDDITELLQHNRNRVRFTATSVMSSGRSQGATPMALPKESPVKNTNAGNGEWEKFTVGQKIILDKADNPNSLTVKLREMDVCIKNDDGTTEDAFCLVACSPVYKKKADGSIEIIEQ